MATLKNVQDSMSGTAPEVNQNFILDSLMGGDNTQIVEQSYVIFRLSKKKKGRTYVDGMCESVLNPKTNKRERIWLLSGADSIWQSELLELLKDKDSMRTNRRSLVFEDSICRIGTHDERALEFARASTKNVGKRRNTNGKFDFFEYDAQEEQKFRLEKQMSKIKTIQAVSTMEVLPMQKLALFLGIKPFDELGRQIGDEGMRSELLIKADSQPNVVNKYIGSKEVDMEYLVRKVLLDGKIDFTGQAGNAIWAGGQGFIAKIPSGQNQLKYLTELAMTNSDEGRNFKTQLETLVT